MSGLPLARSGSSRRRLVALFGVIALVASACGAETVTEASSNGSAAESSSESVENATPSLLSGEYTTLSGETIDLGLLEGQDVVFWFWAPW